MLEDEGLEVELRLAASVVLLIKDRGVVVYLLFMKEEKRK